MGLLARRVAEIVGDYPTADADKQLRIWRLFLRFPRKVLPQVGVLGGKLASMRKRLRGETPDETETEDAGGIPKQPAERAINAATALAHEGLLAKGMRALMRKNDPLPEDIAERVAAGSSAWLLSCRPNQTYGYALKIRLLAACGTLSVCPACGATLDDASAHVLSCTKLEGWNAASRHNAIRDTVHHFCGSHGIFSSREPFVGENTSGTRARADLRITLSTGDTYIDFTVANSMCKTHAKKQTFIELERRVQETKKAVA